MPTPVALLVLIGLAGLFYLTARTLVREVRTGVPHLFFSPHPSYRDRPVNKRSPFLWLSVFCRLWGTLLFGFMTFVAVLFLLESLGVIYQ
jgi:hypothetical protein